MTFVSYDETSNTSIWKIEDVDLTKFDKIIFSIGKDRVVINQTIDIDLSLIAGTENNLYTLAETPIDGKYVGEWSVYEA